MLYEIENLVRKRHRETGYTLFLRDLKIGRGAKIAITGPSGCGKSTALDILGLNLKADSAGKFIFYGDRPYEIMDLWNQKSQNCLARIRLGHMGYVLQSGELLPFLTVGENICFIAGLAGISKIEALENAKKLVDMLGIDRLWHAMPSTLSVGERQRAAIARALASRPSVIIADEPTAALDPYHAAKVMEVFLEALREVGSTLVLATHNAEWAKCGGLVEIPFELVEDENGVTAVLEGEA